MHITLLQGRGAAEIVTAIVLAGGAVLAALRGLVKWVRKCMAFFQRLEKALINVETQLYPNGGASLRDAVNRIQETLGVQNIPSQGKTADQTAASKEHP